MGMNCTSVTISAHAIKRMFQRALNVADIDLVIRSSDVIENYPTDQPYPSCLLHGISGLTHIHAVIAKDPSTGACIVVTVYVPDPIRWSADFKTRTTP